MTCHQKLIMTLLVTAALVMKTEGAQKTVAGAKFDNREFCETDVFEPRCGEDEVVMITEARYGRMQLGRCVVTDYGYLGCQADVLQHLDHACSGRRDCSLRIPDNVLDSTNHSCPKEFKTYLNVSFKCIPVETNACYSCPVSQTARVSLPSGYIASMTTVAAAQKSAYACGSARCPWRIEAQSGQTVNLTLFDFAMEDRHGPHGGGARDVMTGEFGSTCFRYAVIKEETNQRDTPVCGGRGRLQGVYSSVTNVVEVHVVSPEAFSKLGHFVIQYQVIGCPDYLAPPKELVRRHGSSLEIECRATKDVWQLHCNGTEWIGAVKNCPEQYVDPTVPTTGVQLSIGLLVAIIFGIAFVVAVFIVTVGVVCLKRQRTNVTLRGELYYDSTLHQCYELREDFRFAELPPPPVNSCPPSSSSLRKPCTGPALGTTVTGTGMKGASFTVRLAPTGPRRNVYGIPRMNQRPLPSLPNLAETCSADDSGAGEGEVCSGDRLRRTVQADINTSERSSMRKRGQTPAAGPSCKAATAGTPTGGVSGIAGRAGTSANETSNNNPPFRTIPASPGATAGAAATHAPTVPAPQHYTVLDPVNVNHPGDGAVCSEGAAAMFGAPAPGPGTSHACDQSYLSHSDDGSTSGSSADSAHVLNGSSYREIPLRPMREGSQPSVEQSGSGGELQHPDCVGASTVESGFDPLGHNAKGC